MRTPKRPTVNKFTQRRPVGDVEEPYQLAVNVRSEVLAATHVEGPPTALANEVLALRSSWT